MQNDDDKKPFRRTAESRTVRTSRRPEKGKNASSASRASRPGAESVTRDDQTESGNTSLRSRVNSTRRPQKGKNASSTSRASRPGVESVAGIDDQTESVNVSLPSDMESVPERPKDLDNRPSVADVVNASVTNLVTATVVEDDDAQLVEDMKERERENQLQIQRLMERDAEREKIIHNAAVREAERREQDEELEKSVLKTTRKRKFICLGTIAVFLVAVAVVVAVFVTQKPAVQTEYIFIAPTEAECQAIADGDASNFDDLSEEVEVTVLFEVIVEDPTDVEIEKLLDDLKEEAQSTLVPYLAGCSSDVSRRLGKMEERPAFRGHGRNLNSLDYAVAFGSVGDNVEYESCSDNGDAKCLLISMQVSLAIKDKIECDALTEDLNSKVSTKPNLLESDDLLMDDFTSIKVSSIEDCQAVATPEPGPNCCSNNLQDCDASEWCQSRQDRCEGECLASWIEVGSCTGIELWGDCSNDPSGCCAPATCVFQDEYYSQCKPAEETGEP